MADVFILKFVRQLDAEWTALANQNHERIMGNKWGPLPTRIAWRDGEETNWHRNRPQGSKPLVEGEGKTSLIYFIDSHWPFVSSFLPSFFIFSFLPSVFPPFLSSFPCEIWGFHIQQFSFPPLFIPSCIIFFLSFMQIFYLDEKKKELLKKCLCNYKIY